MPMRRMKKGEEKSIIAETEALDGRSNEWGLGRTMSNPQCDMQAPAESLNEAGVVGGVVSLVMCDEQGNGEEDVVVRETVIANDPEGSASGNGNDGGAEVNGSECQQSNAILGKLKAKILQKENPSHVIDIDRGGGTEGSKTDLCDGEGVCRICHLSSEGSMEDGNSPTAAVGPTDLIQLGCGCKDELGIAHSHCAETWFKLRGNRICKICGEIAENVSRIVETRLTQNERRFIMGIGNRTTEQRGGCWQGQPFCNFLLACLVIAFVLPWFFQINLF